MTVKAGQYQSVEKTIKQMRSSQGDTSLCSSWATCVRSSGLKTVHTIEGMVLTHKGKCFLKGGTCLKQKLLTYMSYFKIMRGDFTENS